VIDREALLARSPRRLGGVGLRCPLGRARDPTIRSIPIRRVYALPHVAGATMKHSRASFDVVVDNVGRLERGEPLRHRVA